MMSRRLFQRIIILFALLLPPPLLAWNATGHKLVSRIAWDHLTPTARTNAVTLLQAAPQDACLRDLFPEDSRPLADRQLEFFMMASTWPDIVRPGEGDTRPCTRFHRRGWHFINFFWEGTSGGTTEDREDIETPEVNAVERLTLLRPFAACGTPQCGTPQEQRATALAWILHIAGDIHQPLHTSARVTFRRSERDGDQGGNLFKLESSRDSLHGYWDGIVNRSVSRQQGENDRTYLDRVAAMITAAHPRAQMSSRLRPGDFEAWAREGFETTKSKVYPQSLRRGERPSESYRAMAFEISQEAIALAGYRLADLLNQMFGA